MLWTELTSHLQLFQLVSLHTGFLLAYGTVPMQPTIQSPEALGTAPSILSSCTWIWIFFCFPRDHRWLPASPLVCIKDSDWPGINLLFSLLIPTQIENQYSFQKRGREAQERRVSTWSLHTLVHNIIWGMWDPVPILMTKLHRKAEFFSRVHPKSILQM